MLNQATTRWPKVLVVHNQFQHLGGEDFTAFAEVELMQAHGADVHTLVYDSSDPRHIARLKRRPYGLVFNQQAYSDIRRLIRERRIEVVHCHNLWPMIGPAAYRAAAAARVPIVQTVHDFRIGCLQGQLLRNGRVCHLCRPGRHAGGMLHACYRGSRLQSVALGLAQTVNAATGAWGLPSLFIAPSRFVRDTLLNWGIPSEKTVVKPHFVPRDPGPIAAERDTAVFVGRLSPEKGLDFVISAWRPEYVPLTIIGDGPARLGLERQAHVLGKTNIRFVGQQSHADVGEYLRRACLLILPSITHETFGRAVIEAYAYGVPVLATRLGAASEIVQEGVTGLLFEPHNPGDLAAKLDKLALNADQTRPMRPAARQAYLDRYSADRNAELLLAAYWRACGYSAPGVVADAP